MIADFLAAPIGLMLWTAGLGLFWYRRCLRKNVSRAPRIGGWLLIVPVAFVLRGAFGEVGAIFPALASVSLVALAPRARRLLAVYCVVAVLLWASALGLMSVDLYAAGYEPRILAGAIAVGLAIAYFQWPLFAWFGGIGLVLFAAVGYPSSNLWDAIFDVPSVILAIHLMVRRAPSKLA